MSERGRSLRGRERDCLEPAPVLKVKQLNKAKIRTVLTVCFCVCVHSSMGPSAAVMEAGQNSGQEEEGNGRR